MQTDRRKLIKLFNSNFFNKSMFAYVRHSTWMQTARLDPNAHCSGQSTGLELIKLCISKWKSVPHSTCMQTCSTQTSGLKALKTVHFNLIQMRGKYLGSFDTGRFELIEEIISWFWLNLFKCELCENIKETFIKSTLFNIIIQFKKTIARLPHTWTLQALAAFTFWMFAACFFSLI